MATDGITREAVIGLKSVGHLLAMLEHAAQGERIAVERVTDGERIGLLLEARYFFGVVLAMPDELCFQVKSAIDDEFRRTATLGSKEIDFFSKPASNQMMWIEGFLHESLRQARKAAARKV